MLTMPVVFVSHGAPDALLKAPDTVACWNGIGASLPSPEAILVISAHWEASRPTVSLSDKPATLYDFSGFSPELYTMKYPAPGAPELARRVLSLIPNATADSHRGLDHGAWAPLSKIYPNAEVPVTQLSLVHQADAASHYALGAKLAKLRSEGVLIIASGAITHNFGWLNWHATADSPVLPQAKAFNDWVADRLAVQDGQALLDYRKAAHGAAAHPSAEHFLPLLVALGAAGDSPALRFSPSFCYAALSMDAYVWQ